MPKKGSKVFQLTAYGDEADRDRLFLVAEAVRKSQSKFLLDYIRDTYKELYGDQDPIKVLHKGGAATLGT